jgi:SpoVK/Ycf46/Vps4 family AAA+-type ATPase
MSQDEIDALATSRASEAEHSPSHEGVLTTLLNEMDGVQELNGVTVIAATNRPEVLVRLSFEFTKNSLMLHLGFGTHAPGAA